MAGLVNDIRRRRGLPTLRSDVRLRTSARLHSEQMDTLNFFAHEDPGGGTPTARMRAAGYAQPAAENIAVGQRSAPEVVHSWMNSPGHRANIEDPAFRAIGVGVHLGSDGHWWTQHFGY